MSTYLFFGVLGWAENEYFVGKLNYFYLPHHLLFLHFSFMYSKSHVKDEDKKKQKALEIMASWKNDS